MSTTYDLACDTCRKRLWVAQSGTFYSADREVMRTLGLFLFKHEGHVLRFVSCHELEAEEPPYEAQEEQ